MKEKTSNNTAESQFNSTEEFIPNENGSDKAESRKTFPVIAASPFTADGETPKEEMSFSDLLYKEITNVIGGDNPNQFFCMGLPGTLLEASQYSYDVEKNQPKPSFVEANESKLVNKLFDACHMTASDNGRHLSTQYKTALDVLTPKLNGKLFDAKTQLREVLMTPYPYNFEDGNKDVLTLEQVFFKLYHDYVTAKQEWAKKQVDKRTELAKKYPNETQEDYRKRDDEFLDWYEVIAESEVLVVEEKLGKVLGVFSPGDMSIITGILDSGAGREVSEARMILSNVGKLNPDGGYIYPVTLYPENWFRLLDTSFTGIDLLESPAALAQQLSVLIAQRSKITGNINTFLEMIPSDKEIGSLKADYEKYNSAFNEAFKNLGASYINVTADMLKTAVDIAASRLPKGTTDPKAFAEAIPNNVAARIFGISPDDAKKVIDVLANSAKACLEAQQALVTSAQKTTDAAVAYFKAANLKQLETMLSPLRQQLEEINRDIALYQEKLDLAYSVQKTADLKADIENKAKDDSDVAPNHIPENFMQIIISSAMSSIEKSSSSKTSAKSSNTGLSFFFGGFSHSSSHNQAVSESLSKESNMSIQIGMSVAKVKIGREWFNPGVFLLTSDMYNTSSAHIAPSKDDYKGFDSQRFEEMNKCLLPCFPTAFVIARDVTIKFSTSSSMSSSFAQSVEDHASSGGGFFIFSGSSSSSSSSSSNNAKASSSSKGVTIRFTNPQIIGYYLEAMPADKSVPISSGINNSNEDFISIFQFIEAFQKMLNDHNDKYHKNTLSL